MSYDYVEKGNKIIIDKGIIDRQMWKEYEHGKEWIDYTELKKALELRDNVPIVIDSEHDHTQPLRDAGKAIGKAILTPCDEKKAIRAKWVFWVDKTPDWLLQKIRRKEALPMSPFKFVDVVERRQQGILYDHVAILEETSPRCPITRCGVGVYDSMQEEEKPKELPAQPVEPVQTEVQPVLPEESKAVTPQEPAPTPAPEPATPEPEINAMQAKDEEITALKAQLAKRDAQIKEIREPLVIELTQKGYQLQELNPLSIATLQKMVVQSRAATTEGLPGQVPAPSSPKVKTMWEAREAESKRFRKSLKEKQDARWKDM